MKTHWLRVLPLFVSVLPLAAAEPFQLYTRSRAETVKGSGEWRVVEKTVAWDPRGTAVVICDMWDRHWCAGATRRVAEMAPRMNDVVKTARARGALIIHCPSDTMKFYEGTPGRKLAQAAPKVETRVPLQRWCSLDKSKEAPLPIDDSDGGCDDDSPPPKGPPYPWTRQIATIEIQDGDAITDSAEAYYLMRQRGITNVIVMGVHLNMCVLGRPFSIRQMVNQGQNVLLVRDLTDTMYNPRRRPWVPHCVGNDLMVEHVEKYWCPSITSAAFAGGEPLRFAEDRRPRVVFLIGEDEYKTWETLPQFAQAELAWRGFRVSIIQQSAEDKHRFPGFTEAMREADLLFVSARRRALPKEQLDLVRAHLDAGKPLVGIRTASHAFDPLGRDAERGDAWPTFGSDVIACTYNSHWGSGPKTSIEVAPDAAGHAILTGIDPAQLTGNGSLYRVSPLKPAAKPLLVGSIPGKPSEPIAWTYPYGPQNARIFYTSLGHWADFAEPAFRRLLLNAILWAVGQPVPPAATAAAATEQKFAAGWQPVAVPGCWEDTAGLSHDGIAWYRCFVKVPAGWRGKDVTLAVENVDNCHEAFFNGAKIGAAGRFPPEYQNGLDTANRYAIPADRLRAGEWNIVAIRVFDEGGRGGFKGAAPMLGTDEQRIALAGTWQFRTGDDATWANMPADTTPSAATFARVEDGPAPKPSQGHKMAERSQPLPPAEAATTFAVPADLEIEQVLAEPLVRQPVFLTFDERGRMWVVQYLQYPAPAGLTVVSKDNYWRAVYDRVPEPPPRGPRGLDKITIHEDTDGDGRYDKHKTFVDGLNIATACVKGRGGVWVLNPPYLLFYPDRNDDDVPDGDPVVHLEGFGLEDTHSVVNSLCWGPDGWLYAAQGSTVTANVRAVAPGSSRREEAQTPIGNRQSSIRNSQSLLTSAATNTPDYLRRSTRPGEPPVYSQGQCIWRYHPERRIYEIFAEGGGNAFGVEFDDKGRLFSGHNGGDTRGFHYMQGAYLRKGFEKHGELSNPYAFGYFPQMDGTKGERFSHTFIIYHGGALPPRYEGKLFGCEPLQGRIVLSEITPDGSTFKTRDLERVVTSSDSWFRPVDIKAGPDGAIYIADWYDRQVTHTRNQEGNIDKETGRIYRLKRRSAQPSKPQDLRQGLRTRLVALLGHSNEWHRRTALRLLGDTRGLDPESLLSGRTQHPEANTLETVWALHQLGRFSEEFGRRLLEHPDPQARLWAVRLSGDDGNLSAETAARFAKLAGNESNVEVRAQLACTAKRLPAADALPIVRNLILSSTRSSRREEALIKRGQNEPPHVGFYPDEDDARDPRLPLLCWWAIESKCETDRDALLKLFEDSTLWREPMVEQHLLAPLMRRFAAAGARRDLLTCARLLELSPDAEHSRILMRGFEDAFKGRSVTGLPDELIQAMARHGVGSEAFRLRAGSPPALARALKVIVDAKADPQQRQQFIEILGEAKQPSSVPALLQVAAGRNDAALRKAALTALLPYEEARIGVEVVRRYREFPADVRAAAQTLLASRANWALLLAEAVDDGRLAPADVPLEVVRKIKVHKHDRLAALVAKHWPQTGAPTTAEMARQIRKLAETVRAGHGDPWTGHELFNTACAACHTLFARGGQVGPDLTPYQRSDLDALLLNIVNPSAEIREGYENFLVETTDGRALSGFLVEQDNRVVVVRGLDGQNIALAREEIAGMRPAGQSLMPEGLLDAFTDQQVRDLFAYLRSGQPLVK